MIFLGVFAAGQHDTKRTKNTEFVGKKSGDQLINVETRVTSTQLDTVDFNMADTAGLVHV